MVLPISKSTGFASSLAASPSTARVSMELNSWIKSKANSEPYSCISAPQADKSVKEIKEIVDNLNEDQFEKMLYCEHGGMCEAMANLYKITKNQDYLNLSIRFIHKETINPLIDLKDELEGKHANTQIPKVIGVATLYEITGKEEYKRACEFFWNIVTKGRSYAIGGYSREEHFG